MPLMTATPVETDAAPPFPEWPTIQVAPVGGLDIAYSFDLLECPGTPTAIRDVVSRLEKTLGEGWACWSFGTAEHGVLGSSLPPETATMPGPIAVTSRPFCCSSAQLPVVITPAFVTTTAGKPCACVGLVIGARLSAPPGEPLKQVR